MKAWSVIRGRTFFTLRESKGTSQAHPLRSPVSSIPGGWWKAGAFSLLLHGILALVLVFGVQPNARENRSPVYRVTVLPLQALGKEIRPKGLKEDRSRKPPVLPAKIPTEREQKETVQEMRPKEVPLPEKEPDQAVPASVERATASLPSEVIEPPQEKEEGIREPIPLPMAASSDPNTNSRAESEENLSILLSSSRGAEVDKNATPEKTAGEGLGSGTGMGSGGSGPGKFGDGIGGGRGDSSGGGVGIGLGVGFGGSTGGNGGKGQGTGAGVPGPGGGGSGGSGNGKGSGRGGSGQGGPGNDGTGEPRPAYARNPAPVYPREAKNKSYEGEVLLRVEVLSNGRVGQIEVKKSSGYGVLDQSALTAVKEWKFIPAMKGDVPIPIWVTIPITYRLQ
jgi:TonB family protein